MPTLHPHPQMLSRLVVGPSAGQKALPGLSVTLMSRLAYFFENPRGGSPAGWKKVLAGHPKAQGPTIRERGVGWAMAVFLDPLQSTPPKTIHGRGLCIEGNTPNSPSELRSRKITRNTEEMATFCRTRSRIKFTKKPIHCRCL